MHATLRGIVVLTLVLLGLPLSALAQDATPTAGPDLSTEAGLAIYQAAQADVTADDVGLPDGFELELVANGLDFPSALAVAEDGTLYAALSGYAGTAAQVVQLAEDGTITPIIDAAAAGLTAPITDIAFGPDGTFYVAFAGGIAVVDLAAGTVAPLLSGLPSLGDHQNNQLAFGDDGWVYFGQGTATNSMVVGPDNLDFGWLPLFPDVSDVPCEDVTLATGPFESPNGLTTDDPNDVALTSPYQPFGVAVDAGTTITGAVPCNGAVLRFQPEDPAGTLEVFAWGLRNPYGVVVDADGAVWVIDNGPDARGSRPIQNAPDSIYRLEEADAGTWFGYPDFVAGAPVTDEQFAPEGADPPAFVLADHDALLDGADAPPEPLAVLDPHSATGQGAVGPESWGELAGHLFVASHGDFGPVTGSTEPWGHAIFRVSDTGEVDTFLQNPSPREPTGAVARPVGLAFAGGALYVADLGIIEASTAGILPRAGTGAIWRIVPPEGDETPTAEEEATAEVTAAATEEAATEAPAAETAAAADEGTPAAGGAAIEVTETEFAIEMPDSLPAGQTTFRVTNAGTIPHNFEVEGEGIEEAFPENLQPDETRELTIDLAPGTYEVYCPVGDHRDRGMRLELTVTE